jgi:hypothetical protein
MSLAIVMAGLDSRRTYSIPLVYGMSSSLAAVLHVSNLRHTRASGAEHLIGC